MNKNIAALAAVVSLAVATPALAKIVAKPVPANGQTIRFDRGTPTIEDDLPTAGVRIIPIAEQDHGSFQFMVAIFNKGAVPVNVGIENVMARHGAITVGCFSKDQLVKRAKNRAMWTQIGMAALAGAAAAVQNNNTTINTYTPRGTYTTVIQRPGLSDGQLATIAAGGAGIALTQVNLDKTVAALNDEILQTTTVDPQSGYGGRVILQKLKAAKAGDRVIVDVDVAGEHHLFGFDLVKG